MRWEGIPPTVPAYCCPKHPFARQRGNIWVTHFADQEQFSQILGGTTLVQGTEVYHEMGPFMPASQSTCIIELSFTAQRALKEPESWPLAAAPASAAGVLHPRKGIISQMLRKSQLIHGPISWLHVGLLTPLVLEKEVKQPVLMYTFSSFEKPPSCRKMQQSCEVWSWFPIWKPGRMPDL